MAGYRVLRIIITRVLDLRLYYSLRLAKRRVGFRLTSDLFYRTFFRRYFMRFKTLDNLPLGTLFVFFSLTAYKLLLGFLLVMYFFIRNRHEKLFNFNFLYGGILWFILFILVTAAAY